MFILKKFQKQNLEQPFNNNNNNQNNNSGNNHGRGHGVQPMDHYLQKKFARGIQYNMKILIRGDRNVGKTCLFYRLQGDKFHEEYVASEEIKVASIQWNYNATDDIVKVEIWDVVDKGKKRENLTTINNITTNTKDVLKMHNSHQQQQSSMVNNHQQSDDRIDNDNDSSSSPALDAEFVDVYKGTNGVIFLFDMTKQWTFDYISREIHRCPLNIPILLLANHRDMGHHRVITADQVHGFIESILQDDLKHGRKRIGQIRYAESSMRNGFGLRYLYKFFNLPFLHLQKETMLRQLERNAQEINATCQELDVMADSDEYDYDNFLEMLTNKRRQVADQLSATKKVVHNNGVNSQVPPRSTSMPANMAAMSGDANQRMKSNASSHNNNSNNNHSNPSNSQIVKPMPSIIIGANNPLPPKFQQQFQKKSSNTKPQTKANQAESAQSSFGRINSTLVKNIDDFIPDDGEQNMFRKFLDEPNIPQGNLPVAIDEEDSEEEDNAPNSFVVAKYQEELDPEDMIMEEYTVKQDQPNDQNNSRKMIPEIIKENNSEINSEPEDNQNDKVDDDHNECDDGVKEIPPEQSIPKMPILNCDDLETLENLYISKHPEQQNGQESIVASEPVIKSSNSSGRKTLTNKSSQNSSTKKKKKSSKTVVSENSKSDSSTTRNIIVENGETDGAQINKKKKAGKLKTKTKQSVRSVIQDPMEEDDDEQRKLEEFLGILDTTNDKKTHERDTDAYQMF